MSDDDFIVLAGENSKEDKIAIFQEETKRKIPWDKRVDLIKREFPSVTKVDWLKVFETDVGILGHLINDIMKVDLAQPGKPGKRPSVDPVRAAERYRQLSGDDFTMLPFCEAFNMLAEKRSVRGLAAKVGLDRNLVFKFLKGRADPSAADMESIAKAFRKEPGFFVEYRLAYLFGILYRKMEVNPEATVGFYRKVKGLASNA